MCLPLAPFSPASLLNFYVGNRVESQIDDLEKKIAAVDEAEFQLDEEELELRRRLRERRQANRARKERLRKELKFLERRRKGLIDREISSIEELEKLEKEDRDARRAKGEHVSSPERSPEPEVLPTASSSAGVASSVAGIAFPSGQELQVDPSFWPGDLSNWVSADLGFDGGTPQ